MPSKLAGTISREMLRIENEALRQTVSATVKIIQKVRASYKRGELPEIQDEFVKLVEPTLRTSIQVASLAGYRRTQLIYKDRISKQLSFDLQDTLTQLENLVKGKAQATQLEHQAMFVLANAAKRTQEELRAFVNKLIIDGVPVKQGIIDLTQKMNALGVTPMAESKIAAIYRTQIQIAYNATRYKAEQDSAIQEILWGYEYNTVGDHRVRPEHAAIDGVRLPKDDIFWRTWYPPNGWNCRCVTIPIFNDQSELAKPKNPPSDMDLLTSIDPEFATNFGETLGGGKPIDDTEEQEKKREREERERKEKEEREGKKKPKPKPKPKPKKDKPKKQEQYTKLGGGTYLERLDNLNSDEVLEAIRYEFTKMQNIREGDLRRLEFSVKNTKAYLERLLEEAKNGKYVSDWEIKQQELLIKGWEKEIQDIKTFPDRMVEAIYGKNSLNPPKGELKLDVKRNEFNKNGLDNIEKAHNYLNRLMRNTKPIENTLIDHTRNGPVKGDRPYHYQGKVYVVDTTDVATVVHELMHALERANPNVGRAARELRDRRVAKAKTPDIKMTKFSSNYASYEVGNEDTFGVIYGGDKHLAAYTGKVYGPSSTELTTMVMEEFVRNPIKMAGKDPELFKFAVAVLRGEFD